MDFENKINDINNQIEEVKRFSAEKGIDLSVEIDKLEKEKSDVEQEVYGNLNILDRMRLARHPKRPYTLDYIKAIATDFVELHGDRLFRDDPAIVGGLGKIDGQKFVIIGQQKGRDAQDNIFRNFGMANPEGYRKALRLMRMAERFNIPILTFIDTMGAYPGIEAEEHGQGEAIARNLMEMAGLRTPIISVVIGEGGSGGALGIGVSDKVYMLENAYYSVISPEACASILFRSASKANTAAKALKFNAENLLEMNIIDEIIKEPLGGVREQYDCVAKKIKELVLNDLNELRKLDKEELVVSRYEKFRKMGSFTTAN